MFEAIQIKLVGNAFMITQHKDILYFIVGNAKENTRRVILCYMHARISAIRTIYNSISSRRNNAAVCVEDRKTVA